MIRRSGKFCESCFVCARRAGPSAATGFAWYCKQCGLELAKKVLMMTNKDFDSIEQAACARVAAILNDTDSEYLLVPRDEVHVFVGWVVDEFAKQMREYVKTGERPK